MNTQDAKCVMIIDENLPIGLITNTAAIMGITLGKYIPETIGKDVFDKNNKKHLGIIQFPVPILKGNKEIIKNIREKLYTQDYEELVTIDFSDIAQSCKTYDEFISKISQASQENIQYLGIAVCGNKKKVNKLTGNIPLLKS